MAILSPQPHDQSKIKRRTIMLNYVIMNTNDSDLFWSDEDGWTDYDSATFYTDQDRLLPMEGMWATDVSAVLAMEDLDD
jgi:hypothetical protein